MTPLGSRPAQAARVSATLLLTGAGLTTLWWASSGGAAGAWPLLAVGLLFLIALVSDFSFLRRTPLDLPIFLFLLAAIAGLWAAYDPQAAQSKFWMLVGACVLFYALALQPGANLSLVIFFFAVLGLSVALFFLLTHDWELFPPKFSLVQHIAQFWGALRPQINIQPLHPNVAAGLMAILAPFQLALAWYAHRQRSMVTFLTIALAFLLTLLALLLTSSRGAMLALGGGLAAWLLWNQTLKYQELIAPRRNLLLAGSALLLIAFLITARSGWIWPLARALDQLPGPASAMSRAQLASQTIDLITDFPLSGGGLAAFPGLYSQYILGIPFYFLPNGHNIILDITLEQGLLGALSFLLVVAITFALLLRRPSTASDTPSGPFHGVVAGAALSSFLVMLLHGMVEDTVYGSVALPLLFAVPGLAVMLHHTVCPQKSLQQRAWDRLSLATVGIAALLLLGSRLAPQGRAIWPANLGAVRMARVELAGFPTGEWVHIAENEELRLAAADFQMALQHNPQQRTALHRLGLLALERADFTTAMSYLERAGAADPFHIGIRKALGYSYAWSGNLQQARQHLQTAPFVTRELEAYVAWWQQQGRGDLAQTAGRLRPYFSDADNEQ